MNSIKFYDGDPVEASHLNLSTEFTQDAIKNQFIDTYTYGVINDKSPKTIVYNDGKALGIYGLVAYDVYGNRIEIPSTPDESDGTPFPTLSGLKPDDNMKLIQGGNDLIPNTSYMLVVRYAEISTEPISHHVVTGEPHLMGIQASYELYLRPVGETIEGDIILALINVGYVDGTYEISAVDESVRTVSHIFDSSVISTLIEPTDAERTKEYKNGQVISFTDHVHALGTGTLSPSNPHALSASDLGIDLSATANHQRLLHVDGIRSNNIQSTTSAMYPHYNRESASDYETVYIEPLVNSLDELAVINGISVFPADFPAQYSRSFKDKASTENIGYYLFVYNVNTKQIELNGPYQTEQDDGFVQLLKTNYLFPICSFKFDYVSYSVNGQNDSIAWTYDIVPATFKDRRIFNNNSLQNFRPDEAFALTQFAPIANDNAYLHNVRLLNNNAQTKFSNLTGKSLNIVIDGEHDILVEFKGAIDGPIPADEVVTQLREAFTDPTDGHLYAYPRIISDVSGNTDDIGKLSISAPYSISINGDNQAAAILGFTAASKNLSVTSDGLIKEMIYYAQNSDGTITRNGFIDFIYNDINDISQINYFLGGGKVRRNIFHYTNGYVTRVEEIIEDL